MKKHFHRITAVLLVLVTCFGLFSSGMTAFAATSGEVYMVQLPRGVDPNKSGWGHSSMTFANGWKSASAEHVTAKSMGGYETNTVYCIEPGVPLNVGDKLNQKGEDFWDNYPDNLNDALSPTQIKQFIGRIFVYGWTGKNNLSWNSSNPTHAQELANMLATQFLVWETVVGDRDRNFNWVDAGSANNIIDMLSSNHPLRSEIMTHYNRIVASVKSHVSLPSFLSGNTTGAQTHELTWDGSKYSVTLTDNNNVLGNYDFSSSVSGVSFSVSGNKLTISTTTPPTGNVDITASKKSSFRKATIVWTDYIMSSSTSGQIQNLISYGENVSDPVTGYVKIKVSTGSLNILKTTKNNDGKVEGFQFRVTKDGANIGTFTSGADGKISIPNLVAGWYKVEEINLSDDFVKPTPNPVDVEVKGGQSATVSFDNVKKLGVITVQKTNANPVMGDYSLAGAEFTVKNANGTVVDTIITGSDGKGQSKPLPLGNYTVFESKAPWGFVIDKNVYSRTLSGSQGTAAVVYCPEITVPERPQTGQVKITKLDAESAAVAQGDATLSGAVFDLLDSSGNQVERLYCGTNTFVTSKEIPLGSYTVKEVTPPKGYTLSQKEYSVTIDYAGQEVEINLIPTEVKNTVIKGRIAIIKHSDSPDPQVDPENEQVQEPLDNIVFHVWLKSAGSYENAKPSERDELITNENGWALSKDLPYGTYVVEEVKGEPEHKVCEPFDAFISENDRTYYYNIENPAYYGKVKIVKVDAETDKIIPQANVEFKVKNTDTGEWVTQELLYPTPVILDSYLTNAEGWLVMPQELKFGNYELHEIEAPYGYLLSDKPIPFKVTSENPVAYLEVKMPNKPVMGKVTVEKTGEVLTGATEIVGKDYTQFVPKYEVRGLPGAVFDIIARTDIITPDGTVRAAAGTVVDTITTKADGTAESKLLYLGDYYAIERTAPYGMILNEAEYNFSLVYENQTTAVVFSQIGVHNERQKAKVTLEKDCEIPGNAPEEYNPYDEIIFGLFAREDILTADGTVAIPADRFMEYISFDKDGNAEIMTDLPFGSFYVKELQTKNGYTLNENEYDIVFEYAGQTVPLVEIAVNDGTPIENKLQRGSLKVIKTFEGKETPIEGVPFTITGITTVGTTVTIEAITDENGEINLENLLVGNYTVKELESDLTAGYVLSPEQNAIVAVDEIAEMTINNILMRGDLRIIKTFEGKTVPIAGVKFTVVGKTLTGEDYSEEFETDENGCIYVEGLLAGDYKVQEIASDLTVGYVLLEEQAAVIAHEQITELKLENKLIRGNVKLIKTDKANGAKLAGAGFDLYDPDGKVIASYSTDQNGELLIENLPYGFGYKLVETKAPEGYTLKKTELSFDITENGATVELSAVNEKTPPPENPKTGDDSNLGLWIALLAASVCGIGTLMIVRSRRKKKKSEEV